MELRPVAAEDMERMYLWRNDEEAATLAAGTSMAVYSNVSLDTLRVLYEESVKTSRLDDKWNRFAFSIYTLEGVHIGNCDYRNVNPVTRTATIGIAILAKEYWSKGYGVRDRYVEDFASLSVFAVESESCATRYVERQYPGDSRL